MEYILDARQRSIRVRRTSSGVAFAREASCSSLPSVRTGLALRVQTGYVAGMGLAQSVSRLTETQYLARERAAASKSEFFEGEVFAKVPFQPVTLRRR